MAFNNYHHLAAFNSPSSSSESLLFESRELSEDSSSPSAGLSTGQSSGQSHSQEVSNTSETQVNLTEMTPQNALVQPQLNLNIDGGGSMRIPLPQAIPAMQFYPLSPTAADALYRREQLGNGAMENNALANNPDQRPNQNQGFPALQEATDEPNPVPIEHFERDPLAPAHAQPINRWDTGRLQMIRRQNSTGLDHGILEKSATIKAYTRENQDPNWRRFYNKFQSFIESTQNNQEMVERLEMLIIQINDKPELQQQIHRIAEDSAANCQDGAFGSLIEMEKASLKYQCIEQVKTSTNPELTFSQVLDLAHGFYMLETIEDLANSIGKEEAVEAFLYFLKEYNDVLKTPIKPAHFRHEQYAEGLYISTENSQTLLCSNTGKNLVKNKIVQAQQDSKSFAKSLASFSPYHEYLSAFPEQNKEHTTFNKQVEDIQKKAQEISLQLTETVDKNTLEAIENCLLLIKSIPEITLVISQDELDEIQTDIQLLQNQPRTEQQPTPTLPSSRPIVQDSQEDQSSEYRQRMQQMDNGLLFQFDSNELNTTEDHSNHTNTTQQLVEKPNTLFERNFLKDKINNLAMRTYNNAHRISYFKIAQEHSSLFIATLDSPDISPMSSIEEPRALPQNATSSGLHQDWSDMNLLD